MAEAQRMKDGDFSDRFDELERQVAVLTESLGRLGGNGVDDFGHTVANRAEHLARRGRKAMRAAVTKGKATVAGVESTVAANPLASIAVAFGLGVLLGRLIRR